MTARVVRGVVGALAVAALTVPGAAAKGPGGGGGHGGGGGTGGTGEVTPNNLSVPALFVGAGDPYGLECSATPVPPTGEPVSGYGVDTDGTGYFYVQGIHTWRAGCLEGVAVGTVSATAEWGDNLGSTAKLKVGSPIRVEVGLFEDDAASRDLTGYTVIKLEPSQLDRISPYGTEAVGDTTSGFLPVAVTPFSSTDVETGVTTVETRVWDVGASMAIYRLEDGVPTELVVSDDPAGAEINATGRIVYGYNLRVSDAGTYRIVYTVPNVTVTGTDGSGFGAHTTWMDITVVPGGGQGGGKGGNH